MCVCAKFKRSQVIQTLVFNPPEEESPEEVSPEVELVQRNYEISIHYRNTWEI